MQPSVKLESGVQLFTRLNQSNRSLYSLKGINKNLFKSGAPLPNQIIEVIGDCCGDLLVDFIVRCTLPMELNPEWKGAGVVFLNSSHHISILKITNVLNAQLKHLNIRNTKPIIEKTLQNITLLNCFNEEQLLVTFKCLDKIVQERDNVCLLILDDLTSQYWIARQKNSKLSLDYHSKTNLQLLQTIIKSLNLVLIFSRYQVGNMKKSVDLQVDYKIIGKTGTDQNVFTVIDYVNESSVSVPFSLEKIIKFL